jgi:AraC-like DNA-binding protein
MDMNKIFRSKHSNRLIDSLERPTILKDEISTCNCPVLDFFNENVFRASIAQVRVQHDAIRRIEKPLSYMLQNLDQPIQMPTLGRLAGVSMSHFYYLFKSATGYTPNRFFIRARMGRGCELLRGTDMRVKEVAGALGYVDPLYFSRLFKSVNGVTPSEYRVMSLAPIIRQGDGEALNRTNRSRAT